MCLLYIHIADAIVLQEDQVANRALDASTVSLDPAESITLKVQTSKKSVVYSLAKVECVYVHVYVHNTMTHTIVYVIHVQLLPSRLMQ